MRKGLVDDLKTHLISVTKKYSELNETDMFYKHYRGAVSEGIFGLINTAIVLYENKLYKAAREYLDKSKKIFYNDPELHFIYAKYYLKIREYEQADSHIRECLNVLPDYYPAKNLYREISRYLA